MTVTFFGHSDTPKEIEAVLQETLINLIIERNITMFYVGNHGNFDFLVRKTLQYLQNAYPNIKYNTVLAYLPQKKDKYYDYSNTVYPDGIEKVPRRFAICKRNEWMINNADIVVTFVTRPFGGAASYKEIAEKKGKTIINLADLI